MSLRHRLMPHHTLYASLTLLLCINTALSLWLLGQLGQPGQVSDSPALVAQKIVAITVAETASYARARLITWVAISAMLGISATLVLWLRRELERPLRQAQAMAHRMAGGDLCNHHGGAGADDTGDAGGPHDLLNSMLQMNDSLAGMIAKVRTGTEVIAGSAGEIAAGHMALSLRTEQHATSLADSAAQVAQLATGSDQSATQAQQAGKLSSATTAIAQQSASAVAGVSEAMAEISALSSRIAAMNGVLDGIASLAGMLGISAAVEAARAGESGRPFAVVAAEVRLLAQRLAQAVQESNGLVENALDRASTGAVLAAVVGKSMHELAANVDLVSATMRNLIAASAEQTERIGQLSTGVAALEQANCHNAALLARSATVAVSMREQAGSLSRATAAFVLGPEYGVRGPAIRLVSNNPRKLAETRPSGSAGVRLTAVHGGAGIVMAPRPVRWQGAAARRNLDWEGS